MIDLNKLKDGLYDFIASLSANTLILTFSADLVESNVIAGSINGLPIAPVTYGSSHDETMIAIAEEISDHIDVESAEVTDDRVITVHCKDVSNFANGWVVTEGISQATIVVSIVSGFNIQWERDNQNKAENPRIGLDILSLPAIGSPITVSIEDSGFAEIAHESNLILRIIASGPDASSFFSNLKMAQFFPFEIETLRNTTGLSILRSTDHQNISGFNDQYVEERWTMDITFSFAYSTGKRIDVGIIEEIEIEGTLIDLDNSERTINIDVIKPD